MNKIQQWLSDHKIANLILVLFYYLLVILPHLWVVLKINKLFKPLSRDHYNLIILVGSIVMVSLLFVWLYKHAKANRDFKKWTAWFALTLFFIFWVNSYLFVINIESVHYLQYAVGALLIFPLVKHYNGTLMIATLIGVIDESYQYFYLAPQRTDYFDINDIVTDFLGVVLGLLILKFLQIKEGKFRSGMRKYFWQPLFAFMVLLVVLIASPILSIYPGQDKYMLVRKLQEGFWTEVPPSVKFHVLTPTEGLITMVILFTIYCFWLQN